MLEQTSEFRKALNEAKKELSDQFKDLMDAIQREQNVDRRILNEARASTDNEQQTARAVTNMGDKLQDLLSIQTTMLTELTNINSSIKRLGENNLVGAAGQSSMQQQQQTGGASGWLMGGAAAIAGAAATATAFSGESNRNTDNYTRSTGGDVTPAQTGDVANQIRSGLMERFTSEEMALDEEKAAMITEAFIKNMESESSLTPDKIENRKNVHGTRGKGLYQLTGSRRREYEEKYGEDYSTENQLDFLIYELLNSESPAWESILESSNVGEASQQIVRKFLRPQAEYRERRAKEYGTDTRTGKQALEDLKRLIEESEITNRGSDQFITGHLKEIGDVGGERPMSLYNPTIPQQKGKSGVHGAGYEGASNSVRVYWSAEELEASGLTAGENLVQLTHPQTGELESVSINIQSFDGGENYATTDFIGTGNLGESRDYWNPDLIDANLIVQELGGSLGDLDRRKALNSYIEEGGGVTIPYSEVDVPGNEGVRSFADERKDQMKLINEYAADIGLTPSEDISTAPTSVSGTPQLETTTDIDISGDEGDDSLSGGSELDAFGGPGDPVMGIDVNFDETGNEVGIDAFGGQAGPSFNQIQEESEVSLGAFGGEGALVIPGIGIDETPGANIPSALDLQADLESAVGLEAFGGTGEEETAQEPSSGYTGGGSYEGGTSTKSQTPQIEASIIGRFGWGENLIKYYGLEDIIKTNMLQ